MVLEAALILPVFISFILAMIAFIQAAIVSIALQDGVNHTVQEAASHVYPAKIIYQKFKSTATGEAIDRYIEKIKTAQDASRQLNAAAPLHKSYIPDSVYTLIEWEQRQQTAASGKLPAPLQQEEDLVFTQLLQKQMGGGAFTGSRNQPQVVEVLLPDLLTGSQPYFRLTAEYRFTLPVPFFNYQIVIRKTAAERCWLGQ